MTTMTTNKSVTSESVIAFIDSLLDSGAFSGIPFHYSISPAFGVICGSETYSGNGNTLNGTCRNINDADAIETMLIHNGDKLTMTAHKLPKSNRDKIKTDEYGIVQILAFFELEIKCNPVTLLQRSNGMYELKDFHLKTISEPFKLKVDLVKESYNLARKVFELIKD